jgi:hypothetical protein
MKTKEEITEAFCQAIYCTDKADIIAEADAGTPYTLDNPDEIGDFIKDLIDKETELLQHNLAYNATLNAQFMKALHDISKLNEHEEMVDVYINLYKAVEIAKTALTTPAYKSIA